MSLVQNIRDLKKHKTLLNALTLRYLASRYRGSVLGFFWTLLNPLFLMLVYTIVFRFYIRFETGEHNYTIFLFTGLLQWIFTTSLLIEASTSIVNSSHLITKSMFPAHILPTVACLTTFINYLFSLPLLFIFMVFFKEPFHLTLLLLPCLIFIQFIFLYSLGLMLSILNVYLRDTQHLLANFLNFLFFLSPILYPLTTIPEKFKFTIYCNPFALFTISYHNLILDGKIPDINIIYEILGITIVSLFVSIWIYDRHKEGIVELL